MRPLFFLLIAFVLSFSSYSRADDVCYTPAESEAEQGIRIHSELMVIGLNCAHMADANGNNLYLEHQKFTNKNKDLFSTYEKIMMTFFKHGGEKEPEQEMHALRTRFANKISADVAKMRPDVFCKTYSKRIEKVTKMDKLMFRKWAATPFEGHPVSYPLCKK